MFIALLAIVRMLVKETLPANQPTLRTLQQNLFSLLQKGTTLKKLTQIHAQLITHNFSQKSFILVKILSLYVTNGHLLDAYRVFENITDPSTSVWNQIIRGYAKIGNAEKCVQIYNRMVESEAEPDGFSYSYVLSGCVRGGLLKEGEQVHGRVLSKGFCSNVFVRTNLVNLYVGRGGEDGLEQACRVFDEMGEDKSVVSWNSLLAGYIRCGNVDGARRVFYEMPERNLVSWTTLISGFAKNGRCKEAISKFHKMRGESVELDQVVLVAVLSACAELGELELGKWIHSYINETWRVKNLTILVSLQNALVHMYSSCGRINAAYSVFKGMERRSIVSWTSMITGFAKQGYAKEAICLFLQMQSLGVKEIQPDEVTFLGVLSACSHAGYVIEGRQFFDSMRTDWGIRPKIEHYGCMVDLLSRAGYLDEAYKLVEAMPMKPNHAVWGALLGGCKIHKNHELASSMADKLIAELNPDNAAGYLVLLSNVYATAKRWKDFSILRQKLAVMLQQKPPGRSWIQVNGVTHDFLAGDWNHKNASSIYEMLEKITWHAKMKGYTPDTSEFRRIFGPQIAGRSKSLGF